ncbi:hypothetical protein ACQW5G_00615 [Fructilactobacillus sp. Tb1]|uniref:hypothetical protein n=1 Tax=Fructilactobacillus sp. Tb1 TaxID=3422304 RepID=UPI003D28D1B8
MNNFEEIKRAGSGQNWTDTFESIKDQINNLSDLGYSPKNIKIIPDIYGYDIPVSFKYDFTVIKHMEEVEDE